MSLKLLTSENVTIVQFPSAGKHVTQIITMWKVRAKGLEYYLTSLFFSSPCLAIPIASKAIVSHADFILVSYGHDKEQQSVLEMPHTPNILKRALFLNLLQ